MTRKYNFSDLLHIALCLFVILWTAAYIYASTPYRKNWQLLRCTVDSVKDKPKPLVWMSCPSGLVAFEGDGWSVGEGATVTIERAKK